MIKASLFWETLKRYGYSFVSGTPCSYLKPLINSAINDPELQFVDGINEGDAVAMATGAVLGGTNSVVMFQNSGLGNAINALSSLCHPFQVPMLLIITHRGNPDEKPDEPQHTLMGQKLRELLDILEIRHSNFPETEASLIPTIERIREEIANAGRPYALIMSKEDVEEEALLERTKAEGFCTGKIYDPIQKASEPSLPKRQGCLNLVTEKFEKSTVFIATTGYTGRELYAQHDASNNFYMVGSMGSASSLGLGLALQQPDRRVVVLDGDGALLMRMGNMANVGVRGPEKLVHLLFDNGSNESTGRQPTVSPFIDFAQIAQGCGYSHIFRSNSLESLSSSIERAVKMNGPVFIHQLIECGVKDSLPRPSMDPSERFRRMQNWLAR